jgi:hypothetical protein
MLRSLRTRWALCVAAAIAVALGGGVALSGALTSSAHGSRAAAMSLSSVRQAVENPASNGTLRLTSGGSGHGSTSARNWGAGGQPPAFGKVTAVNGTTKTGTCGTAGSTGSFSVTNSKTSTSTSTSTTVDVTGTTKFFDPAAKTKASFVDVCVGKSAGATGTTKTTGAISATTVSMGLPNGAFPGQPFGHGGFPQPFGGGQTPSFHAQFGNNNGQAALT